MDEVEENRLQDLEEVKQTSLDQIHPDQARRLLVRILGRKQPSLPVSRFGSSI